jgi:hypothetical protein
MIIDVAFVDILMIFATALSVVLRASRHISSRHSPAAPSYAVAEDGLPPSPSLQPAARRYNAAWAQKIVDTLDGAPARWKKRLRAHSNNIIHEDLPSTMHAMSVMGNVLGLISNCLTHLLRHSQVIYALFLVMCDVVMAGRERPRHRGLYLLTLMGLIALLYMLHDGTVLFGVGDLCGYLNGLLQLFLLGVTLGCPVASAPNFVLHHYHPFAIRSNTVTVVNGVSTHTLVVEFTLERCAACVSTICYLAMLLDEGEAVYSCHTEFVRWYVANVALLLQDMVQLWRCALISRSGTILSGTDILE